MSETTKKQTQRFRWDRVAKVRAHLESGFYDDSDIQKELLARSVDLLLNALQNCPPGDGDHYRDLVASALANSLKDIVDIPLMQREVRIDGGRADIEIPLRTENLNDYPLWLEWHRRYDVRCILAETKNQKDRATHEDISQLMGYLRAGKHGRFALIVSRNGFTKNALNTLAAIAREHTHLVLPFDNDALCTILRTSAQSRQKMMECLRRKETFLVQHA